MAPHECVSPYLLAGAIRSLTLLDFTTRKNPHSLLKLTVMVQQIDITKAFAPCASIEMIAVTPDIKAIWPVPELLEFRAIHVRSSAHIITITSEDILSLVQAANLRWLNQFQAARLVRKLTCSPLLAQICSPVQ